MAEEGQETMTVAEKRAKVWREWLSEGWPDMSLDLDQQALDLINAWEAGEYLRPAQKKAALQVVVRDALAQARAEGLRQAAEVALAEKMTGVPPPNWDASDLAIAEATVRATAKSIAARIRALAEAGNERDQARRRP